MMLTAFSISSIESSTPTALLRESAPNMPIANRIDDNTKKCCKPIGASAMWLFLPRDDDGADQPDGQQDRCDPERQDVRREQQIAKLICRLGVQRDLSQAP